MTLSQSANTSLAFDFAAYESGKLNAEQTLEFFQELIDSGRVWKLQGHYGRVAMSLIKSGKCMLGSESHTDYFGNHVPSRDEVVPGTPGSTEYVLNSLER